MEHRDEAFKRKFADAAKLLGMRPEDIVSVKVRENVNSYSEYHELLKALESEFRVRWKPVDGDLQGRAYLLTHRATQGIMVEHESGLEILYIAGSVASLIGLVPLVLQCWQAIRRRLTNRHHPEMRDIEIRRLDEKRHLIEEQIHDALTMSGISNEAMTTMAGMIEKDLRHLVTGMDSLTQRVENLERHFTSKRKKPRQKKKPVAKKR